MSQEEWEEQEHMVEIATREHDDEVLEGLHGEGDDQPLSTEEVEAIYEATLKINEKAVGNVFTAFNQQQAKEQMRPDDDIQEELRARDQADGHRPGTYFATSVGGESTLGTALDNPKSKRYAATWDFNKKQITKADEHLEAVVVGGDESLREQIKELEKYIREQLLRVEKRMDRFEYALRLSENQPTPPK